MDRVLRSAYLDTALGMFAAVLGLFAACCLIVGLAVILTWIGGHVS